MKNGSDLEKKLNTELNDGIVDINVFLGDIRLLEDPVKGIYFLREIAGYFINESYNPEVWKNYVGAVDSTLKKSGEQLGKLQKLVTIDELTGLYNRRHFNSAMKEEEALVNRRGKEHKSSLAILDLDYFKRINDNYGHPAGDYVLRNVASILREQMRGSDKSFRYGGEEFAIILPATDGKGAYIAVEHLRESIKNTKWEYNGSDLGNITISSGISDINYADSTEFNGFYIEEIVRRADKAMYEAKGTGRNRTILSQS